ncbi:peptide deformylase, mitochondrial-like [Montipora foliosa]|uniref:peptide deformylase, mitochondrial-like n=1 Tax=Montipora foliosa TaxID=591990 RepID=UPI0035F19FF4
MTFSPSRFARPGAVLQIKFRLVSNWLPSSLRALLSIDSLRARQVGDPILREEAEAVEISTIHSPEFKQMVERMFKVMRKAKGQGIAAPQIGVGLQVIAIEYTGQHIKDLKDQGCTDKELKRMGIALVHPRVFINPQVRIIDSTLLAFREGCLSIEGYSALVPRAKEIEISALNVDAQPVTWRTMGWPARIIQHEVEHLKGNLYVDSMMYESFMKNDWGDYVKK